MMFKKTHTSPVDWHQTICKIGTILSASWHRLQERCMLTSAQMAICNTAELIT